MPKRPTQTNYTTQQVATIRAAIKAGRDALVHGEARARVFASAFFRADGLQLPGGELDKETRRRIESHIMVNINGRDSGAGEEPAIRATILRELARIHNETERFLAMQQPHLLGYQMVLDRVAKRVDCKRYAAVDMFGLGAGVVPAHEIVVLPPCCDGVRWQPIYEDE